MTDIFKFQHFYLVGIKGVAMTALTQLLLDAHKVVTGTDVTQDFVTKKILQERRIKIDVGFNHQIPKDIDCVIYTAAHQGPDNPLVKQAEKIGIPTYSHAQAQASLFNTKKGVAVCGVGGKTTTSAMIAWILEKTDREPSFAVGVGNIAGLNKTAQWDSETDVFVVEADEYVTDPQALSKNQPITPRFSFLYPYITACTNIKFDHPDVYRDFNHTKKVFETFFQQIDSSGYLILNYQDLKYNLKTSAQKTITFGNNKKADFYITQATQKAGVNQGKLIYQQQEYLLELRIPGYYNLENATTAIITCHLLGIPILASINALSTFNSTQRRFEYIKTLNQVTYYDDYAHHPDEVSVVIKALSSWYPHTKKIVAFQPHTYSRTKKLLPKFIDALGKDSSIEVILLDIFASAREKSDYSISSNDIVKGIVTNYPQTKITNLHTIKNLQQYFHSLTQKAVVLTVGAGDIYEVYKE